MRNRTRTLGAFRPRTLGALVGALTALALAGTSDERSALACSCVGPEVVYLGPKGSDAPINTHVRLDVPSPSAGSYLLRTHPGYGAGPAVVAPTKASVYAATGSGLETVDLEPLAPLAPRTRYEVVVVNPATHPPNTVVGTFVTGAAADNTPPRFQTLGKVRTKLNLVHVGGGMCSVRGPWLTVSNFAADDPGRPQAQLAFLLWGPDAHGKLDTKGTPSALVRPFRGELAIGQTSLCDPRSFPLPGSSITLAIALVDEAGNRTAPKVFRADLTRPTP